MGEGYIETNGVRLWYEDLGDPDGEPVVLIMGAAASAMAWPPMTIDALVGSGRRVVRFDNRDIGLSTHVDPATGSYSLYDLAADTLGLMDALGIDRAHLVGASMGGMISQLLAIGHPDRVRSLTLLISTPGPDARLRPTSDAVVEVAVRPTTTPEEIEQREVDLWRVLTGSAYPFDEERHRDQARADAERGTNPNSGHAMAVVTAPSRLDALGSITAPTLIFHGTEDPIFPIDHGEALAAGIPGATLVRWEGVGHEVPPQVAPDLVERLLAHLDAS